MIQRLSQSSLSFRANELTSPREGYDSQMVKNSQTAQKQNKVIANLFAQLSNQIPMQGSAQKLDVIA